MEKLGSMAIAEGDKKDLKFAPMKKVKLVDKLDDSSPLKKESE
jgi:hypothetical protein